MSVSRVIILLFLLIAIHKKLDAQDAAKSSVYLKNGSVITGKVILMEPDGNLKIQTEDGSIFVFPMNEVSKVVADAVPEKKPGTPVTAPDYYLPESHEPTWNEALSKSRVVIYFGPGLLLGSNSFEQGLTVVGDINDTRPTTHFVVQRVINGTHSAGGGLNIAFHDIPLVGFVADYRYYFLKKRFSPFLYVQSGYSIPVIQSGFTNSTGGLLIEGGAGVRIHTSKKRALCISFGYYYQEHRYTIQRSNGRNQPQQTIKVLDIFTRVPLRFSFYR